MLINISDITIVMQGDIRPDTKKAIRCVRETLPQAHLILSTFNAENIDAIVDEVDEVVFSVDPGAMPSFVKLNAPPTNNINRQIATSKAGLEKVKTSYVVKMRTDCFLHGLGFIDLLKQFSFNEGISNRLVVSSFFTRHPYGLSCYLFHISDWFVFGLTTKVRKFFSVPFMSFDDATWFERHMHLRSGTYAARRFRARFTPEQYITINFANALGYKTPRFLNEWNMNLVREYQYFLAKEVIVAEPSRIGFKINKYGNIERSFYQKIDCLDFSGWVANLSVYEEFACLVDPKEMPSRKKILIRLFANKFRHLIIRVVLCLKGGKKILRKFFRLYVFGWCF